MSKGESSVTSAEPKSVETTEDGVISPGFSATIRSAPREDVLCNDSDKTPTKRSIDRSEERKSEDAQNASTPLTKDPERGSTQNSDLGKLDDLGM